MLDGLKRGREQDDDDNDQTSGVSVTLLFV